MVLLFGCARNLDMFLNQGCSGRSRVWLRPGGRILNDCQNLWRAKLLVVEPYSSSIFDRNFHIIFEFHFDIYAFVFHLLRMPAPATAEPDGTAQTTDASNYVDCARRSSTNDTSDIRDGYSRLATTIPAMTPGLLSGDFFALAANESGRNAIDDGAEVETPRERESVDTVVAPPSAEVVEGRLGLPNGVVGK